MSALDVLGGFLVSGLVVVLLEFLEPGYRRQGRGIDCARAPHHENDDRR
jgi:hypothetical protein